MIEEVRQWLDGVSSACVVDISGLDAITTNEMRGEMKRQDICMHLVPNRLARRALSSSPLAPLAESLCGPSAIVYGEPVITDIARFLVKWAKQHKRLGLKEGIFDGDPELCSVELLSKMKTQPELVGEIAWLLASAGRRVSAALQSPIGRIAGCLKVMGEKGGED